MKKNRTRIVFSSLIVGFLLFVFAAYFFQKKYHENIRKHKKMYCYEKFRKASNAAFIIEDLQFKDELINYYKKVENGENPVFNFPLLTLATSEQVYVLGHPTTDTLITEVVSYYDRGDRFGGSYLRGYVYTPCLHKKPLESKSY